MFEQVRKKGELPDTHLGLVLRDNLILKYYICMCSSEKKVVAGVYDFNKRKQSFLAITPQRFARKICVSLFLLRDFLFMYVFIYFSFIVVKSGGTFWHSHRFLQYVKYIIHEFTTSTILLHLPPPIPRVVSTGIIFCIY
jgi:hypothetical protein